MYATPVSNAESVPFAGSGAAEMMGFSTAVELGNAGDRRFAYTRNNAHLLCDYTEKLAGSFISDTSFIAHDLMWAIGHGMHEVTIVLPRRGSLGDLGLAAIAELARVHNVNPGVNLPVHHVGLPATRGCGVVDNLKAAREALSSLAVTVLVGGEQRLTGLSGIAREWTHYGLGQEQAQKVEGEYGRLSAALRDATPADLLGNGLDIRGIYAGTGGGLALGLAALGARIFPMRNAVAETLGSWCDGADMAVYVCAAIAEDLPEGLHAATAQAQAAGIPIVVVYDSGSIRRGELAALGLNGAYEVRPERSYGSDDDTPVTVSAIPGALDRVVRSVSHTWGW